MQFRTLACAITLAMCCAAAVAQTSNAQKSNYKLYSLGTVGGSSSSGNGINNLGWISGTSETKGDNTQEAFLWLNGLRLGLGTLGGPNSSIPFPAKDDRGILVGISDTALKDPWGENFCAFASGYECQAFAWRNGKKLGLPNTLGGNNSRAAGANNQGLVIGWAETGMQDTSCIPPAVLQYVPVVWGPNPNQMQVLPTLPNDPDGAAVAINNKGQIVGISGPCGDDDGMGARHAVLWQNGTVTNLGDFGGQYFNTAAAINNGGVIAGWLDAPNDTGLCDPACYGALWTPDGKITQIGPLPGDAFSLAYGINDRGQVVGQSIDANGNSRAFIWQNGQISDLNEMVPPGSPYLVFAGDINNRGEVTGGALDPNTGELGPGFLAVPTHDGNVRGASRVTRPVISEKVRKQIMQNIGLGRIGGGRSY